MSKFNGLRLVRGRLLMSSIVVVTAMMVSGGCEQPQGPSAERRSVSVSPDRATVSTSAPTSASDEVRVEVGDALVLERGGEAQVRRG